MATNGATIVLPRSARGGIACPEKLHARTQTQAKPTTPHASSTWRMTLCGWNNLANCGSIIHLPFAVTEHRPLRHRFSDMGPQSGRPVVRFCRPHRRCTILAAPMFGAGAGRLDAASDATARLAARPAQARTCRIGGATAGPRPVPQQSRAALRASRSTVRARKPAWPKRMQWPTARAFATAPSFRPPDPAAAPHSDRPAGHG